MLLLRRLRRVGDIGWRGLFFGAVLAWGWAGGAAHAAGTLRVADFLATEAGLTWLRTTPAGQSWAYRLLGWRFAGTAAEISALKARIDGGSPLSERFRREMAEPLRSIDEELHELESSRGALSAAERNETLFDLAKKHLPRAKGEGSSFVAASELRSEESARALFSSEPARPLQAVPGQTFEMTVPVAPESFEARLDSASKVYPELLKLEQRYLREIGLEYPDRIVQATREALGREQVSVKEVIEQVLHIRKAMARELGLLARGYEESEPFLAKTLNNAKERVGVSANAWRRFENKAPELGMLADESSDVRTQIMDYSALLIGELGELKVVVRLPNVADRGIKAAALGKFFGPGALGDDAREALTALSKAHSDLVASKELDVIQDGGFTWSEVKAYQSRVRKVEAGVVSNRVDPEGDFEYWRYEKLLKQARQTVKLKKLLESDPRISRALRAMGKTIRLRIYFIEGITVEAASELEALGFEVYGVRYLTWLSRQRPGSLCA